MNIKNTQQLIDIIGKFKDLKRTGWINHQVKNPESDADHSFSVALLALLLAPQSLNMEKCLKLALVHDLAEVYAGDYTPSDSIAPETKADLEYKAVERIAKEIEQGDLIELFTEYEAKKTKEAIFINALDKIDNVITATYYDQAKRAPNKLQGEFGKYADKKIAELSLISETEVTKELLKTVLNLTNQ